MLKVNVNIDLLVDDDDRFLDTAGGNTLPIDSSYHHASGISIQKKTRGRQANFRTTY